MSATGVPETPGETDRDLADAVKRTILKKLDMDETYKAKEMDKVDFTLVRVRRMGREPRDRPRLVHVTVNTQLDASSIIRNRRFLKGSGVSVLDFLTPEELAKHKKHLPEFLEARKDPTKWVTLRRGELRIVDRSPPRVDPQVTATSNGEGSADVDMDT